MATTTTDQGLTLPASTDAPNVPADLTTYNTGVESRLVKRYTSSSDRNTRLPSPTGGHFTYLADVKRFDGYDGSNHIPAVPLGAWTDFSSATIISVGGGVYTKGSTTYSARYSQQGKAVDYAGTITVNTGGGFTAGAGSWSFLLPVTAAATTLAAIAVYVKDSGTALYSCVGILSDSTHFQVAKNASSGVLDSNGPGTSWATGDEIRWSARYEAA